MTDASGQSLAPPAAAAAATLTLTPPEPVAAVAPEKAGGMVPLDAAALPALDEKVAGFVDKATNLDPHSPDFAKTAEEIRTMGDADIRAAADKVEAVTIPAQYNVIAQYPIATLKHAADPEAAAAFVDLVLSPPGQAILKRFGFGAP